MSHWENEQYSSDEDHATHSNWKGQSNNNNTVLSVNNNCHSLHEDAGDILISLGLDNKFQNTLRFLNEELSILGQPSIYTVSDGESKLNVKKLVNVCYELVNLYRRNMKDLNSVQDKLQMTSRELEVSQRKHRQTQRKVDDSKRSIDLMEEKERQIIQRSRSVEQQFKQEKGQVARLTLAIQHRETQYRHEKKKLERELSSLKDQLSLVRGVGMNGRGTSAVRGAAIEMLNCLSRLQGKRQTWALPKGATSLNSQEELQKTLIRQHEAKVTELMMENRDLRQCIVRMKRQFDTVLLGGRVSWEGAKVEDFDDDDDCSSVVDSLPDLQKDSLLNHMPYDLVRESVENDLRETWHRVVDKLTVTSHSTSGPSSHASPPNSQEHGGRESQPLPSSHHQHHPNSTNSEEMIFLRQQILKLETTIQKQEDMLKKSLTAGNCNDQRTILGSIRRQSPSSTPSPPALQTNVNSGKTIHGQKPDPHRTPRPSSNSPSFPQSTRKHSTEVASFHQSIQRQQSSNCSSRRSSQCSNSEPPSESTSRTFLVNDPAFSNRHFAFRDNGDGTPPFRKTIHGREDY